MWPEKKAVVVSEYVNPTTLMSSFFMVRKQASWLMYSKQLCRNCLCTTTENYQDLCLGMQRVCFVNSETEACSDLRLLPFCLDAYHFHLEGKKTSARMI